ncbi:MAG: phosphatidylglycerophosphatase A [Desulfovibrionales bacterium]
MKRLPNQDITLADRLAAEIACLGPVGRLPGAPGTWGSLAATVFAPWMFLNFSLPLRFVILVLLFFVGALAASQAEKVLGRKDPQAVVIDEVLGQWLCLAPFVVISVWELLIGFFLFRFFDILKPWPIRRSELWLPKGYGVMIDDALAGVYAAAALAVVHVLFFLP